MFNYSEILSFADKKFIEDELECVASQNLDLFENSIKDTIDKLEKKYNEYSNKEYEIGLEIATIYSNKSEQEDVKFKQTKKDYQENIEFYEKQCLYSLERHLINEQLKSVGEMLIINAFKNIEINIKTLIEIAYPKVNSKDFYKWESLKQFFKNNNIQISKLKGYTEILHIKDVNNTLKHNGLLNDNIKKIEEFKDETEYNFVNLINFYERVKFNIPIFLNELVCEIKKDLFVFDESRIEEISNEYKLKMNNDDLKKFIEKLSQ